jgi:hypothetical protein
MPAKYPKNKAKVAAHVTNSRLTTNTCTLYLLSIYIYIYVDGV